MRIQSPLPTTRETPSISRSRASRASRQPQMKEEEEYLDADAEGEEILEGEDADEDSTLYCFCQKQSYGDVRRKPSSSRNTNNFDITYR